MAIQEFKLTLRTNDLLELYRNDFSFKLFSSENYQNLAFIGLFLILIPVSVIGINYDRNSFFLMLVFICGLGYYIINIASAYWKIKQKETGIKKWIKSVERYKEHRLAIHERYFKYYRGTEMYMYEIDKMTTMKHDDEYFYCKLISGTDLVLPAKSFEEGGYAVFTKTMDEMEKQKNDQSI